jgi:thymidylate synthase
MIKSKYILDEYDDLLERVLKKGKKRKNRTGVDTLTIFGTQSRYDISEYFPALTRRKIYPKSIFAELLWFLSGSTNNKDLQTLGSNIWTPWVSEEFEKKHGYERGDLGPIYGFQLRSFGGDYKLFNGFDQLSYVLREIAVNPESRRILFSLWNPNDLNKQVLPSCHVLFQIDISVEDKTISGMLTQRSADLPIGVPANIIFYGALLYMLGQQTGYCPSELIHSIGNVHIYENQIESVEEYLSRPKPDSPTLILEKAPSICAYQMKNLLLKDYRPLPPIKIPVEV